VALWAFVPLNEVKADYIVALHCPATKCYWCVMFLGSVNESGGHPVPATADRQR
jgi:hypothetical protein